jgi:hypothetical protein
MAVKITPEPGLSAIYCFGGTLARWRDVMLQIGDEAGLQAEKCSIFCQFDNYS